MKYTAYIMNANTEERIGIITANSELQLSILTHQALCEADKDGIDAGWDDMAELAGEEYNPFPDSKDYSRTEV